MRRALAILLAGCSVAAAQDAAARNAAAMRDALEWTIALRGRFAQMSNRVVRVHATAGIAHLVCTQSPADASGLYRDAIAALNNLPRTDFAAKGTTALPAASFTGLWKFVVPAALKCDPNLASLADNQQSRERMDAERHGANATLTAAWSLIDPKLVLDKQDNNDRAAQMVHGALDAADPDQLDYGLLTRVLSQLRDRAPDLSDDLFLRALDFVMAAPVPDPTALQELANYLFVSPDVAKEPDPDQAEVSFQVSGANVYVLTVMRASTNPDLVESLIDTTLRLFEKPEAVSRNPIAAFSLAWQLITFANDLTPDRAPDLESAATALLSQVAVTAQVKARVAAPAAADPTGLDPTWRDYWTVGRISKALAANRFDQARGLLPSIDQTGIRAEVSALVNFNEAAAAVKARNPQAISMANLLRPGIKRSLLYVGIVATAPPDIALQVLPLAARDIAPLFAEPRVRLQAALAAALVRTDTQSAMSTMNLLVAALNDVYTNPRRGKFDPKSVTRIYNKDTGANDSALILPVAKGFYEAIQPLHGRRNFPLRVSGADSLSMPAFLAAARTIDPARLEAALLDLSDENTRAQSLVKLAEVRIQSAR